MVDLNKEWGNDKEGGDKESGAGSHIFLDPEVTELVAEGNPLAIRLAKGLEDAESKGLFDGCSPILCIAIRHRKGCLSDGSVSKEGIESCDCKYPDVGVIKVLCDCAPIWITPEGTARRCTKEERDS